MSKCGIYKIENLINHKKYIGQSIDIENRLKKHFNSNDNFLIHKSIKKYGKENFSCEILELCNIEELNDKEIYWINYYNSIAPNGYNMIPGGSNGAGLAKGKPVIQYDLNGEYIQIFASAHKASLVTGVNHHSICDCCNKKYSHAGNFQWRYLENNQNFEENISQLNLPINNKIIQLTLDGKVYNLYSSLNEVIEKNPTFSKSGISQCLHGKNKTANSFQWKYISKDAHIDLIEDCKKTAQIIQQLDLNENVINEFSTISEAAQMTHTNIGNLSAVINGKRKTANGFKWKKIIK